ncbi:OmpA family protein [bacterium]|nr:OmpA family protein [bacterium]
MRLLINTSAILSLVFYVVPPFAAQAKDLKTVMVGNQEVICLPNKQTACPDGALCAMAINPANCQANAEKVVAKEGKGKAEAKPGAKAEAAQTGANQGATDQAAADKAASDKAASDKALAEKLAAEQAKSEKIAADKAAKEKAAKEQAAQEKLAARKAAEKAAADKVAADKAAADKAAADKAAADKAAADKAAADQTASGSASGTVTAGTVAAGAATAGAATAGAAAAGSDQALADKLAADQNAVPPAQSKPLVQVQGADQSAPTMKVEHPRVLANGQQVVCLPDHATPCPTGEICVVAKKMNVCQTLADRKMAGKPAKPAPVTGDQNAADVKTAAEKAAAAQAAADQAAMDKANIEAARKAQKEAARAAAKAAAADPSIKIVEAPVVPKKAEESLQTVLDTPVSPDATVQAPPPVAAAAAAQQGDGTVKPSDLPPPKDAQVTHETVTQADTRASNQDFKPAPVEVAPGKKTGLSDLEKVGLVALGALAIGAIINGNKQVVENTGDRVVVRQDDGSYQVYKDDSSLMRQPGSDVTTQTFSDGSTRSIFTRPDGSQIVTIRDASGRVLQRIAYDRNGRSTMLIDDLRPEHRVDFSRLPQVQPQNNRISVDDTNAGLTAALATANADDPGQKFSLRQIRTIPQVRYLAPTIDVPNVNFDTGSAAIQPTEAQKLNKLGKFITDLIARNPGEVFLVEGYTDAVGSAASNLALSDRRAESVAKVLTEYFQVPPENLVVQGYGESDLLVQSQGDERANRRVAVRIITPLLQQAAN